MSNRWSAANLLDFSEKFIYILSLLSRGEALSAPPLKALNVGPQPFGKFFVTMVIIGFIYLVITSMFEK